MTSRDQNNHWLNRWHVSPSTNKDYDVIDGLRGVAILMVVAAHHLYVNPNASLLIRYLGRVAYSGSYGVILFFTLSGFLISLPFWKRKASRAEHVVPPGYFFRRFWKIYPPFALSILVLTILNYVQFHDASLLRLSAVWLAGLAFVFPLSGRINPVMWTLVVEVQFYTLLPFIFILLKRVSPKVCLWIVPSLFLVAPLLLLSLDRETELVHRYLNLPFPDVFCSFIFGVLLAGLDTLGLLRKKWAALGDIGLILLALSLFAAGAVRLLPDDQNEAMRTTLNWLVMISCGCLLCYVMDPRQPRVVLLCAPWLRWCGIVSYEWYLVHQPIFAALRDAFGPADGNPLKYIALIGSSLLIGVTTAALFYRFFSLPILKYGRSTAGR